MLGTFSKMVEVVNRQACQTISVVNEPSAGIHVLLNQDFIAAKYV